MSKVERLITQAQERLTASPLDVAHGLDHHQRVFASGEAIVSHEGLNVNQDLLHIALWWHDLESRTGATSFLEHSMSAAKFDAQEIALCCQIVSEHSFGETPTLLESKILYDADKLDYFSLQRINIMIEAQAFSLLTALCQTWLGRIDSVMKSFHFPYSKGIAHAKKSMVEQKVRECLETYSSS